MFFNYNKNIVKVSDEKSDVYTHFYNCTRKILKLTKISNILFFTYKPSKPNKSVENYSPNTPLSKNWRFYCHFQVFPPTSLRGRWLSRRFYEPFCDFFPKWHRNLPHPTLLSFEHLLRRAVSQSGEKIPI